MQIANSARDMELFARHAGRRAVQAEDVMLLGRRNVDVEELLRAEFERIKAEEGRSGAGAGAGAKKRGRPSGAGAGGKGKAKKS